MPNEAKQFKGSVTATEAFTTIVIQEGIETDFSCNLEIENAGDTNPTTDFKIQLKDHPEGEFYDYLSGSDFDAAIGDIPWLLFCTTIGPQELPAGSIAHVQFRATAAYAIQIQAKCGAALSTEIEVRGSFRGE